MAKPQDPASEVPTKARVLIDCEYGNANAVVTVSLAQAQEAQAAGLLDTDPSAVDYAESLAAPAQ